MIRQVLVAAGGLGARMSARLNDKRSKCLMEYKGQTMVGHLLDALKGGGVERYVISAGAHNYSEIQNIVRSKSINAVTMTASDCGFRRVPYHSQNLLNDSFLFVCGHQPMSPQFVSQMVGALNNSLVITSYDNKKFPTSKERKLVISGEEPLRITPTLSSEFSSYKRYLRNPYVIDKDILRRAEADGFAHTFSYYLYLAWTEGAPLRIVEATMPPEFDFDFEFERTKEFLEKAA